jgi:malonate-semialdehyde dehydrogenase (acetylating)/methylmalonate-semialdehyde dehydrogenase
MQQAGIPPGVVNLVHGAKEVVDAFCTHPGIAGVSFVGSSAVAKHVYETAAAHGKRVQALGGAKNFIVVMPDAEMGRSVQNVCDSIYGCAGQRCLAGSIVVGVGDAYGPVRDGLLAAAKAIKLGDGSKPDTTMGPVISEKHRVKVLGYVEKGVAEGARLLLDGRDAKPAGATAGNWIGPTIFEDVKPGMTIAKEEIFGPVACLVRAKDLDDAIGMLNSSEYGNAASIFTTSGKHAREFKAKAAPGMIGINIGVAAPMAFFPFGGSKASLFGDLKAHGSAAIDFYTSRKAVISRWF